MPKMNVCEEGVDFEYSEDDFAFVCGILVTEIALAKDFGDMFKAADAIRRVRDIEADMRSERNHKQLEAEMSACAAPEIKRCQ